MSIAWLHFLAAFLSRLCGGEGLIAWLHFLAAFLSRLCGGEVLGLF